MAAKAWYMQVAIVKEFKVEASDELQAERAAFAAAGDDAHNIVGMKCYGDADDYNGNGALSDDMSANVEELKTFNAIDPSWCEQEAL